MKKLNRILSCFMLLICVAVLLSANVFADELKEFDKDSKCKLGILLENEDEKGTPVADADVTIYHVADVSIVNNKARYDVTAEFSGYAKRLDGIDLQKAAGGLFDYALSKRIKGSTKYTDSKGKTEFSDLDAGVYLVAEIKGNKDYVKFKPFLAVLPYEDKGEWVFNVLAKPKFSVEGGDDSSSLRIKKVWSDDGKNRPEYIEAQLLCDGEVYQTVRLSDENGWQYILENIDIERKWSVKEINVPEGYAVTYYNEGFDYTICNSRRLIKTGQLRWPVPVLMVGGLVLITAGVILRCKGSGKKHE